jgi:hypothetical protein
MTALKCTSSTQLVLEEAVRRIEKYPLHGFMVEHRVSSLCVLNDDYSLQVSVQDHDIPVTLPDINVVFQFFHQKREVLKNDCTFLDKLNAVDAVVTAVVSFVHNHKR